VKILGLDPSLTSFGWAFYDTENGDLGERGLFKTSSKQVFIDRYVQLRNSLQEVIQVHTPDRVGIEYPVFNDLWSEGMYGLFLYSCEALRAEKMDVVFFTPMQVKAHAREVLQRPKGWKMDKADMIEAAKTETGIKGKWNHNVADAFWVAKSASRFWQLYEGEIDVVDLTPPEKSQFTKIHTYVRGKKAGQTVKSGLLHRENDRFFLWSERDDNGT
jgi:Holliday junction resolvasome RuvABC endonuclease subunit